MDIFALYLAHALQVESLRTGEIENEFSVRYAYIDPNTNREIGSRIPILNQSQFLAIDSSTLTQEQIDTLLKKAELDSDRVFVIKDSNSIWILLPDFVMEDLQIDQAITKPGTDTW